MCYGLGCGKCYGKDYGMCYNWGSGGNACGAVAGATSTMFALVSLGSVFISVQSRFASLSLSSLFTEHSEMV